MALKELSDKNPDGTRLGQSAADLVAFYGATPTSQPASASQAAPLASPVVSISATQWAFSSSAQAQQLLNTVIALRAALVTAGIVKGAA